MARQSTRKADAERQATAVGRKRHRPARQDRGAETKARLIEAGLEVFGRLGFEAASTREIARAAGANLAAIVYHFGSKEALHVAVAEYVEARITGLIGPTVATVIGPEATASPKAAAAALDRLLGTFIEVLLGEAEAERWARFIVREQMQPTAAFDVISRQMRATHALGCRLAATILGGHEDDEDIKLRVFTLIGQILVFRVAHAFVLQRMEWVALTDTHRTAIRALVVAQTHAILGLGPRT